MIKYYQNIRPAILFFILLFLLVTGCTPSKKYLMRQKIDSDKYCTNIRVLIYKSNSYITVTSESNIEIKERNSKNVKYKGINKNVKISPEKVKTPIVITSEDEILYLNNTGYRGVFEVSSNNNVISVVNIITIEEYLYSVVPGEIPASWSDEVLKAQAVAARTYALHHISKRRKNEIFDLDATTNFQVYKGITVEDKRTTDAVKMTSGEIIESDGKPIVSYFHSTCGGNTADDRFVWQDNDFKYLQAVKCNYCKDSPSYSWETVISLEEIKFNLNNVYKNIKRIINISFKKRSGRVISVAIRHDAGTLVLTGNQFRMLFPGKILQSLYFKSYKAGKGLKIIGKGWGHGVGMCQYGAKGMAEQGFRYKQILKHYYKNISVSSMNKLSKRILAGN